MTSTGDLEPAAADARAVLRGVVRGAYLVLPCRPLEPTLRFFVDELGFAVEVISPADEPRRAVVSGHGVRIALEPDADAGAGAGELVLRCEGLPPGGSRVLQAPNGTRVRLVDATPRLELPPLRPQLVVCQGAGASDWIAGRAGMRYRDLIPGRQGGRIIASQIRIEQGGPVPDYVHHHLVRVQLIVCCTGWVKVVFEDQGPPIVLRPGDAVLQPPGIRHRVLECSAGLTVIEISSPAHHETFGDPEMTLPTPHVRSERSFGGQRFVHHRAQAAPWTPWRLDGWTGRDLGITAATDGLARAWVARPTADATTTSIHAHDGELRWIYVLTGAVTVRVESSDPDRARVRLRVGDGVAIPPGVAHGLSEPTADLEVLEFELSGPSPPQDRE